MTLPSSLPLVIALLTSLYNLHPMNWLIKFFILSSFDSLWHSTQPASYHLLYCFRRLTECHCSWHSTQLTVTSLFIFDDWVEHCRLQHSTWPVVTYSPLFLTWLVSDCSQLSISEKRPAINWLSVSSCFIRFTCFQLPDEALIVFQQSNAELSPKIVRADKSLLTLVLIIEGLRERTEHLDIFRSTSKSRPNNIGGKMSIRPYVRPSTKSFFDLTEIWYIGRGRWVMHGGMPYGRIQGQGHGHEPLKVWIPSIFKTYLLRHLQWELASDH